MYLSNVKYSDPKDFLKAWFVIFKSQKYVKKGYMEMTKTIYLEPLKKVLGYSILQLLLGKFTALYTPKLIFEKIYYERAPCDWRSFFHLS